MRVHPTFHGDTKWPYIGLMTTRNSSFNALRVRMANDQRHGYRISSGTTLQVWNFLRRKAMTKAELIHALDALADDDQVMIGADLAC